VVVYKTYLASKDNKGVEHPTKENNEKNTGGATGGQTGGALSETQQQILNLITEKPSLSRKNISKQLHISESTMYEHLDKLKRAGALERVGGTRGYWKVNWR
jgi:ATP-dependent DNA helicase RecG